MKYFIEITLLPDAEIDPHFLWSKVFMQVHLALVENKRGDDKSNIGVSFPNYKVDKEKAVRYLGKKLRVFANSEQELEALRLPDFLMRLEDYVHVRSSKPVPDKVQSYAFFSRLSEKSSDEALARRRAKRLSIPYETALKFFQDRNNRALPKKDAHLYPFISFKSLGTGDKYPVTIVKTESEQGLVFKKGFNTYGLSSDSSVPIF